jgi:hypothetical protein
VAGGLSAALHGGTFADVVQGAALGAFFSAWSAGVNTAIAQSVSSTAGRTALMAGTSGVVASARGGDFGDAYIQSFAMRVASPGIEQIEDADMRIAAEATVAGTAAEITGNNFENAALQSGFSRLFADTLRSQQPGSTLERGFLSHAVGKIWNLPNTIIGLAYGGLGYVFSDRDVRFENNSITFRGMPLMPSAMTLGNVIVYGNRDPLDHNVEFVDSPIGHNVAREEYFHTIQGEVLGPLYFPAHVIGGVISIFSDPHPGLVNDVDAWHRNNPFETGPMRGRSF